MRLERAESVAGLVKWDLVSRDWPDPDTRRGAVYRATIGARLGEYDSLGHMSLVSLIRNTARDAMNVDPWRWG